uniref:Uncharacterized protein n=1 Tax=Oryza nivara TaxID=4536 RepID=A0A0E0I133_ORYNI
MFFIEFKRRVQAGGDSRHGKRVGRGGASGRGGHLKEDTVGREEPHRPGMSTAALGRGGGIEPPRSIPSIGNFAVHDDVVGELAIFRGTSTSWVIVAGAAPVAVEIAVGELGFADNGEWGTEMVEPDRDGWLVSSQPGAQASIRKYVRGQTAWMAIQTYIMAWFQFGRNCDGT